MALGYRRASRARRRRSGSTRTSSNRRSTRRRRGRRWTRATPMVGTWPREPRDPASRSVVALLAVTRAGDASDTCRGGSVG